MKKTLREDKAKSGDMKGHLYDTISTNLKLLDRLSQEDEKEFVRIIDILLKRPNLCVSPPRRPSPCEVRGCATPVLMRARATSKLVTQYLEASSRGTNKKRPGRKS